MMCSCDLLTGAKTCNGCRKKQLEGCESNFVAFDLQQQIDKGFVISVGSGVENYPILLEKLRDARIEALVRFGDLERDEIPRQFFILFDKKALT